jgi:hypothetical protein
VTGSRRRQGWIVLALAGVLALPFMLAGLLARPHRLAGPLHRSPWTVTPWIPPGDLDMLRGQPLANTPGLVLRGTTNTAANAPPSAQRMLVMRPDTAAAQPPEALTVQRDWPQDPRGELLALDADGTAVLRLRAGAMPLPSRRAFDPALSDLLVTAFSAEGLPHDLNRFFAPVSAFSHLSCGRIAAEHLLALSITPDGKFEQAAVVGLDNAGPRLQTLAPPASTGRLAAGSAWQNGRVLPALLDPGRAVYVFDEASGGFAPLPGWPGQVLKPPSGQVILTFALTARALALRTSGSLSLMIVDPGGAELALKRLDPLLQDASGNRYRFLPWLTPSPSGNLNNSQQDAERIRLRSRDIGRSYPASAVGLGPLDLVPLDADRLAIVDQDFGRVLVVEHD